MLFCTLGIAVVSCNEEEAEPVAINPSLLLEVRYVSLAPDNYSAQTIMVLNKTAVFGLTLHQFDKGKKKLYTNIPFNTQVRVSDGTLMKYPFLFRPKTTGTFTFKLEGYPAKNVINESVTIIVLEDKQYEPMTLPVVFHYFARPGESVPEASIGTIIRQQLEKVSAAYGNLNGSRDPNSVDSYLSFEAATVDPGGQMLETPGLHVVRSEKVSFKDSSDEDLHRIIWDGNFWSPRNYINVWVVKFEENYSWARFPFLGASSADFPAAAYGTFLKDAHFGISSVLTHEFGHMLNLYHNFESTCDGDADRCRDTRDYQRDYSAKYPGNLLRTDCTGVDFIGVNYMDYYPTENNTFTYDQRERMRVTIAQCPFLPTPANRTSRRMVPRSGGAMQWTTDPASLIW